ncbi:hypothetical protein [Mycobacterium sp. 1423905.2]|uniref:hypothetical protein n=1 Tax=Mycobacterium sp. 1423905.2 TaxID=1856859 RepID=UPI0007FC9B90|nr:hypothetical protein [Mycobacterium sp. 1423905.2]OBJ50065.1 hypothetical protein A9W95_24775 [Mycobacterium sp. 1423905.2]
MTTSEHVRSLSAASSSDVLIAGVPWPRHKVFAVLVGVASLLVIAAVTASAAPAVLGAAALAVAVGLVLRVFEQSRA